MRQNYYRTAVVLGLLSAIGPFAIDMYLPALPIIGADLKASPLAVQMSLLVFFLGMGLGQIVIGPLSDMVGRKPPIYVGLAVFALASVGAALSPTVEWLIAFRVVQGLASSPGMVVPRAVVRDLMTGHEAARMMALLMLVFSISPILAPLAGSFVIAGIGWRAVFWFVTGAAIVAIALIAATLEETRPAEARTDSSLGAALRGYGKLLRDRHYLGLVAIGGFGIAGFFVYLANSSYILIDHYRLSPTIYALFFSANSVAFFSMSQMTGRLARRYGLSAVVRVAITLHAATMVLLAGLWAAGLGSLPLMGALLFVGFGFLGLVIPSTAVLAMEEHGEIAGTASAMMGTLHFAIGGAAMFASGLAFDGTPLPMLAGVAATAVIAFALAQLTLSGKRMQPVAQPAE